MDSSLTQNKNERDYRNQQAHHDRCAGNCFIKDGLSVYLSRYGQGDKEAENLPAAIKAELVALCTKINELVPNDFNYVLFLGNYNPGMMLEFYDGAMSCANCQESFNPELSLFEQLKTVDWDRHRTFGMSGSQIFDEIRELSKEAEPILTMASEIQKRFPNEMESFAKAKRVGQKHIFLLKFREDEGVTETSCDSMKDLRGDLCDLMTCGYDIIGIIADKKLLPPRKVDKLKREVLVGMKESMPISYARAVGMF